MKSILVVKSLSPWHHEMLRQRDLIYEYVTPLRFEYRFDTNDVSQKLQQHRDIVITSARSVEALKLVPSHERQSKRIFSVGDQTANELVKLGFHEVHFHKHSNDLATKSNWNANEPLLYLNGNLRQDTLCTFWQNHAIPFTEVRVYNTILTHPKIDWQKHTAILFFSPSGVESICAVNAIPKGTLVGSIGPTTTRYLREIGFSKVVEAPEPTFISLIDTIKHHL